MKASLATLFLILAGCTEQAAEAPAAAPADDAPDSSVFDPLTGSLDRAAGVEDTLQESAAARRRALEEAEGR